MGGAKAYFKAKANIAKRDKKFEGIGAAVGALGSIAAITHSKMKTNKEAWEQTERALNIAEEGGYTFEEDILPSEGGNLWERFKGWGKSRFTNPKGDITGTSPEGKAVTFDLDEIELAGATGAAYGGNVEKYDIFYDSLYDGRTTGINTVQSPVAKKTSATSKYNWESGPGKNILNQFQKRYGMMPQEYSQDEFPTFGDAYAAAVGDKADIFQYGLDYFSTGKK